ncbi:hypothetical protein HYH03_010644 [Edaphochlamys debaryana]|uniref:MYND-type domain-containing protein n=1 Tax=Edaphochlamys debaryana TaxID=47281 RepID=A0A835Y1S7_9CHLO|nr:hypothetical protein HYH03_010644 [Edaphochlamys debaryana]|eukprot:KAG2490970.1 hypothetical protein HYH03_010644 [Edaphochlamys debaryana]
MVTQAQLEKAWLAYMLCTERAINVFVERSLWQPAQRDVKLSAAHQAGVPAWLLRTLRALPTRVTTAITATTAWAVCNTADAACVAADVAAVALSLCLAALHTPRAVQDWAGTAPHAAALLDPALLTALAQAARGVADLARHAALPSTQALVAGARSPRPTGPRCALACAQIALTASQAFNTIMLLVAEHLGDFSSQVPSGCTDPVPAPVTLLAEGLRESGLAGAAAWAVITCPGPATFHVPGIGRAAVAVPEGVDSDEENDQDEPCNNILLALFRFWDVGCTLKVGGRPGAPPVIAALGEALGHPDVASLRLAALEVLWTQAGMGPDWETALDEHDEAQVRMLQAASSGKAMAQMHFRVFLASLGLWQLAKRGLAFIEGGGGLPPEPGVPPEVQLARLTARSAEAVCRLARGQGLHGLYGAKAELSLSMHDRFLFLRLDHSGLPAAAWSSAAAPHWAEAAAWALAAAVEALARGPPRKAGSAAAPEAKPDKHAAEVVDGNLCRMEKVARALRAAWQRGGPSQAPAASASGREAVLSGLRRAGLGASLDHALRLAYAAADRAAVPGAAAWDVQAARWLEPVPGRALAVVDLLGLDLLGPVEGSGGADGAPLGLGDVGGLAVTVAKRALALAGRLEAAGRLEVAEAAEAAGAGGASNAGAEAAAAVRTAPAGASVSAVAAEGATAGSLGSVSERPPRPSQAQTLRHSLTAVRVCVVLMRQQRERRWPPPARSLGAAPAPASAAPATGAGITDAPPASVAAAESTASPSGPSAGDSGGTSTPSSAAAAAPHIPALGGGAASPGGGAASPGGGAASPGGGAASPGGGAASPAGATSAPAEPATPRPVPAEWGPLALELEGYLLRAAARLAAAAAAVEAAAVTGPAAGPEARLVVSCLTAVAVLCRTSEPGSPGGEARLLSLQPHRLAAAACRLLCAWRPATAAVPAAPAAAAPAAMAAEGNGAHTGGTGVGGSPGQAPVAAVAPAAVAAVGATREEWQVGLVRILVLALGRLAAHSPGLAARVRGWLQPPPADGCTDAGAEGAAQGEAEAGARGCLAQAWSAALGSQAAAGAGAEEFTALGLALLRAAQGGDGGGGSLQPSGDGDDSSGSAADHDPGFRQTAAALLTCKAAKGAGTVPGPLPASLEGLFGPSPAEGTGPRAEAAAAAAAGAAVLAAPLPLLLAPPPLGRALTQLLVCGCPGCATFGGESEEALPLKRCGGCRAVRYCGAACQRAHWQGGHRAECGAVAAALAGLRGQSRE